jgi:hypothetical protein
LKVFNPTDNVKNKIKITPQPLKLRVTTLLANFDLKIRFQIFLNAFNPVDYVKNIKKIIPPFLKLREVIPP